MTSQDLSELITNIVVPTMVTSSGSIQLKTMLSFIAKEEVLLNTV
ncbi:hypothetical protein SBF1_9550001 [Candidatus Desulfosporosinus infrequens]|uniref:Uncharacterized protein n=1 Tax=Candidatus Desulfosporosinus infrequens TaxID=2043169 RepID=A0A2U3LYE1_9FIRM|nr:hypothetical protein SBF1_9550001 [Candidatus Desulfosporosinus infrequens]